MLVPCYPFSIESTPVRQHSPRKTIKQFNFLQTNLHYFADKAFGPVSKAVKKPVLSAKAPLTRFGSVLRGTDASRAPAAMRGRTFTIFVPQRTISQKKSLTSQKNRGQQGDKREKVKKLKYLFTISYRLSLFPASESRIYHLTN